jgi:hypothetical protein
MIAFPLIPAFSLGEKENWFQRLEISRDWVGRMCNRMRKKLRRLFPLLGERVRVRGNAATMRENSCPES